jgi:hypothetical protein
MEREILILMEILVTQAGKEGLIESSEEKTKTQIPTEGKT